MARLANTSDGCLGGADDAEGEPLFERETVMNKGYRIARGLWRSSRDARDARAAARMRGKGRRIGSKLRKGGPCGAETGDCVRGRSGSRYLDWRGDAARGSKRARMLQLRRPRIRVQSARRERRRSTGAADAGRLARGGRSC
ncbi:hypothetical protein L1887_61804 [Cichorium endivia]|nr:hypothetical protein L1887_61804 [Cichorium endivia]